MNLGSDSSFRAFVRRFGIVEARKTNDSGFGELTRLTSTQATHYGMTSGKQETVILTLSLD